MANIQIPINLFPSQKKFILSKKKEVVFVGGRGNGKSGCLLIAALKHAKSNPDNEVLIVRKTYGELTSRLLPMLFSRPGLLPRLLPDGTFEHHQSEHKIKLNNGGTIRYASLDDPLKIRGFTVGNVFVDELIELEFEEYSELLQILRSPHGTRQIYACTNPSTTSSWMYKRFVLERNDEQVDYINCASTENTTLPADYIESLRASHSEDEVRRIVGGEWGTTEGMIYKEFDRARCIKHMEPNQFKTFLLAMDYGFHPDPTAILLIGLNGSNYHVLEEYQSTKLMHDDILGKVNTYSLYNPNIVVDPSAAGLIGFLESNGHKTYKATNDRKLGIGEVRNVLEKGRLTIEPTCRELIEALENYRYDSKNEPIHKNSHLPDALRYGCMYNFSEPDTVNYIMNLND